jgi:hypothetical protein
MIPDVQRCPWSDLVVAYLADPDASHTAAVHLHSQGRASATLHPRNGGPARDLEDPPPNHAASAHQRLLEATSPEAPLFLRRQD